MGAISNAPSPAGQQRFLDTARVGLRLSRQIFRSLWQAPVLITFGLIFVLTASAVGVIYASHHNRVLFNQLGNLQAERDSYQREWSQLLLEQSALGAQSRIEQFAIGELGMVVPGRDDLVIVPIGGKYQRVTQ